MNLPDPVLRILHRPTPAQLVAALCNAAVAGGSTPELAGDRAQVEGLLKPSGEITP